MDYTCIFKLQSLLRAMSLTPTPTRPCCVSLMAAINETLRIKCTKHIWAAPNKTVPPHRFLQWSYMLLTSSPRKQAASVQAKQLQRKVLFCTLPVRVQGAYPSLVTHTLLKYGASAAQHADAVERL